jgi:hypothetical protein
MNIDSEINSEKHMMCGQNWSKIVIML